MRKFLTVMLSAILLISCALFFGCGGGSSGGSFTVTFDGNGGVQVADDGVSLTQTVSSADELVIPSFEREGYRFNGWDLAISLIDEDATVKAQWVAVYTVIFDGNGGVQVAGDGASLTQTVSSADELVIPNFEREGYKFNGWDVSLNSITENLTVKAQWIEDSKQNVFTVKLSNEFFYASKNKTIAFTINGTDTLTILENELITSLNLLKPTIGEAFEEDFSYSHWAYKDKDGKYKKLDGVRATSEIAVDGVITLYPVCYSNWTDFY